MAETHALCLSGGSGAPYVLRLLEVLLERGDRVLMTATDAALRVLRHEAGIDVTEPGWSLRELAPAARRDQVEVFAADAVESTPASGSARIANVVVLPCSMGTLARIAHGFSSNLVERAADVALKEGRRLIVVPRETPLSVVHLRNMLLLAEAGAVMLPAMPGLYHRPESVSDLVDFVVARILDRMGIDNDLVQRWSTPETSAEDSPWNEGET